MRLNELNQKLIAAARAHAPSDHVPYAFEKRIMALLASRPVMDNLALWNRALWRAAVSCAALGLVLGVCSLFLPSEAATVASNPATSTTSITEDLSQALENTLLASVDQSASAPEELQ